MDSAPRTGRAQCGRLPEQCNLRNYFSSLVSVKRREFVQRALHVKNRVHPDIAIGGGMQVFVREPIASDYHNVSRGMVLKFLNDVLIDLISLRAVRAAQLHQALRRPS